MLMLGSERNNRSECLSAMRPTYISLPQTLDSRLLTIASSSITGMRVPANEVCFPLSLACFLISFRLVRLVASALALVKPLSTALSHHLTLSYHPTLFWTTTQPCSRFLGNRKMGRGREQPATNGSHSYYQVVRAVVRCLSHFICIF
jgi:hypothetical protein